MRLACRYFTVTCLCLLAISMYALIVTSPNGDTSGEAVVFKHPVMATQADVKILSTDDKPVLNFIRKRYTEINVMYDQKHASDQDKIATHGPSQQEKAKKITYIQEDNMDLPGGDMPCAENELCKPIRVRSVEQAQLLCNMYGSQCKGFVYSTQSGEFLPKSELMHKMVSTIGSSLFIKETFAQSNSSTLSNDTCAVPLNQIQSTPEECRLPDLDPYDETITKLIDPPKSLQCPGSQLSQYLEGVLELRGNKKGVNITNLMYQSILRPPHKDWGFELGDEVVLIGNSAASSSHEQRFQLGKEFIRVQATSSEGSKHMAYHAQVIAKSPRPAYGKTGLQLSVVIIGLDSLSAAHFQRALPETYKFLKDELQSVFLDGYSIVGDGTTPAITALLTGKFEGELPEARRGFQDSAPLDRWPHIFKDFKAQGYATLFSEDCPVYGSFNYRLHGFTEPPTDHFGRYFWEAAHLTSPYCVHSQPQHQIHFDYIKSFCEAYRQQPKFGLFFLTDISHNNLESIYHCANDFLRLLKDISDRNLLNDTVLVIMSDHGFRYGDARTTLQGKLEERLPVMSLTFPKWFLEQYPEMVKNVKQNSDIVTSPFDLHATFKHILTYPQVPSNLTRGDSLFNKINRSRHCEETGVAEHYCPCVQWSPVDTRHDHVNCAAQAVVDHVNNLTGSDRFSLNLCAKLQLNKVLKAYQKITNPRVRQFLGSSDIHGRKPMFSRKSVTLEGCVYQVVIQTTPGEGLYEASVSYNSGKCHVTGEISRINLYGEQPRCILDKRPDLRKFCLCKDYTPTKSGQ